MPDFTLDTYKSLLETLLSVNYIFQTFANYIKRPEQRVVILRHDVDAKKLNSLMTAQLEKELGIRGTYYFRIVPESFDEDVIRQIHELRHEIGYHYEDLSKIAARGVRHVACGRLAQDTGHRAQSTPIHRSISVEERRAQSKKGFQNQLVTNAIMSFRGNLEILRRIVPVETVCMHGSPLSRWDNRIMWQFYDYHDFGITGEPYFDLDFNEVLYLTDTGRRWDGEAVTVRDKVMKRRRDEGHRKPHAARRTLISRFHSTFDIINSARTNALPSKIMITVHPQRWTNEPLPWLKELVWQNIKNTVKRTVIYIGR